MHDADTIERLTDFVRGRLPASEMESFRAHCDECPECRDWIATFRQIEDSLEERPVDAADLAHPDSEALADWALGAGEAGSGEQERISRHVARCPECFEHAHLVRQAVAQAVEAAVEKEEQAPGRRGARTVLALAASVLVVIGSLVISRVSLQTPRELVLTGKVFEGQEQIAARDSIVVQAIELRSGAEVTLSSGDVVSFDNGFSVQNNASLTVLNGERERPSRN